MPNSPARAPITVLLPTLEINAWLEQAIGSVISDMRSNDELIVLFDGREFVPPAPYLDDSRIRKVPLGARQGLARALNLGIRLASNEFIARMDADDLTLPGRFDQQVAFLERHPEVGLVGTGAIYMSQDGDSFLPMPNKLGANPSKRALLIRNMCVHPSIMFRKTAVWGAGGYNERCRRSEDYEMYLRVAKSWEIRNLSTVYLHYRVHPNQMSKSGSPFSYANREILRLRRSLAKDLDIGRIHQSVQNVAWLSAQLLRYLHLR